MEKKKNKEKGKGKIKASVHSLRRFPSISFSSSVSILVHLWFHALQWAACPVVNRTPDVAS
jgi:hypothetical protein